jgi:radical SAM protein with 4Fe4S-binding SPASM domain
MKTFTDISDIIRNAKTNAAGALCSRFPGLIGMRKPHILVVEASNRCNLVCPACATAHAMHRPKGCMTPETFDTLLRQAKGYIRRMQFSYAGEPLLNEHLPGFIAKAVNSGITCKVDTNGMLLEKYAKALVDSGLQRINVALNGIDQETLSKYRKNADFATIVRGAKAMAEYKKLSGRTTPAMHMQFIVTRHNELALKDAEALAREIGFDVVEFKSFSISLGDWMNETQRQELAEEYLPRQGKFLRYRKESGKWVFEKELNRYCADIFSSLVVFWNGEVTLCCMDPNAHLAIGNILEQDLSVLWKSAKVKALRRSILRRELPVCRNCSLTVGHIERIPLRHG